ncbi:WD40/YVTN repeat-like-containing domain [Phaffia rhodozyma]|uniref:WD40/YVTN repeat-like-containing domain n=1 Tax=Phaffia rhodozyma TaxID=264483 RepID=A0A0F7SLM8_PHARH|nr:WD40/YVTN repeat-like-containing domain [Phaffia rhodozyma]
MSYKRGISPSSVNGSQSKRSRLTSSSSQPIAPSTPVSTSTTSTSTGSISTERALTLDASTLSDELFLEVFSYLSPWDLSMIERVDRHFSRLANDSLLWKRLYMTANPYAPSLRGSRSSTPSRRSSLVGNYFNSTSTGATTVDVSASDSLSSPLKAKMSSDCEDEQSDVLSLPLRRRKNRDREKSNINWKEMFRISTNWSSGRSTLTPLSTPKRLVSSPQPALHASASISSASKHIDSHSIPSLEPKSIQTRTILALLHPVILYATQSPTSLSPPEIQIFLASRRSDPSDSAGQKTEHQAQVGELVTSFVSPGLRKEKKTGWLRGEVWVTDLSVDKQDESSRVYVGYSSGAMSILTIDLPEIVLSNTSRSSSSSSSLRNISHGDIIVHETYFQPSPTVPPLSVPIISALYGSLLVTCTDEFSLSFYTIPDEVHDGKNHPRSQAQGIKPFKVVRSHTSWFPASISINPLPLSRPISITSSSLSESEEEVGTNTKDDHRVVVSIGFTIPVYPDQWTVSIQQFQLRAPAARLPLHAGINWTWIDDRILSALMPSVPFTYPFESLSGAGTRTRGANEIGSVGKVSSLAMDGRWICLAGEDNRVQIFEVPVGTWTGASKRSDGVRTKEKMGKEKIGRKDGLVWRHTLWDHHAAVTSVSCLDGRCITADSTGRLLIWSLDQPFDPEGLSPLPLPLRSILLPSASFSQPHTPPLSSSSSTFLKTGLEPETSASLGTDDTEVKDDAKFVEVLKPRFKPFEDPSSSVSQQIDTRKVGHGEHDGDYSTAERNRKKLDGEGNEVRGKECIKWVGQDAMTVVTVSTARMGEGHGDERVANEERIKVWGFDG